MTTQGKKRVFDKVSVLYNNFLGKYFDEYCDLPVKKKKKKSQGLKMRKYNESSAENKIKNETEQLLLKYKHGNNIHEYGKQQNEQAT